MRGRLVDDRIPERFDVAAHGGQFLAQVRDALVLFEHDLVEFGDLPFEMRVPRLEIDQTGLQGGWRIGHGPFYDSSRPDHPASKTAAPSGVLRAPARKPVFFLIHS